eukprot:scaffold21781_cov79-Skeletonema_marinoi.AAC.1
MRGGGRRHNTTDESPDVGGRTALNGRTRPWDFHIDPHSSLNRINGELRSGEQDNTLPGLGIQNEPGNVRPRLLVPHEEVVLESSNGELQSGE